MDKNLLLIIGVIVILLIALILVRLGYRSNGEADPLQSQLSEFSQREDHAGLDQVVNRMAGDSTIDAPPPPKKD